MFPTMLLFHEVTFRFSSQRCKHLMMKCFSSQTSSVPSPVQAQAGYSKILNEYESRVRLKQIHDDPYQRTVVNRLVQLDEQIRDYTPSIQSSIADNFFDKITSIFGSSQNTKTAEPEPEPKVRGLYLYGSVGCGKTMLMDLFFENCCIDIRHKRRIHFHSFMLDFHNRFHQHKLRQTHQTDHPAFKFDPIPAIAREIVDEAWLLCLDEFQVTDIGDAMILKNFFKQLFACGMVLIATSNRRPDDLYKNGLQRSNFLPFIPLLKKHCDVFALESGIDYRRLVEATEHKVYYVKDEHTDRQLDLFVKVLANQENDHLRPKTLTIKGRNVTFKRACGGVLDSSFAELCDRPLGAIDYLTIAQYYHTVIVRDIPKLTMKLRGQARRFITMIDTFYDHHVRVIFSAEVPCDELFSVQPIENALEQDANRMLMDDLGLKANTDDANASIFSGEEEMFAFERAKSRLYEMQTPAYWNFRDQFKD